MKTMSGEQLINMFLAVHSHVLYRFTIRMISWIANKFLRISTEGLEDHDAVLIQLGVNVCEGLVGMKQMLLNIIEADDGKSTEL